MEKSIAAVEYLKREVDIPSTIQEAIASQGMSDDFFFASVEEIADRAFDDRCTAANPRYPLIEDLNLHLASCSRTGKMPVPQRVNFLVEQARCLFLNR